MYLTFNIGKSKYLILHRTHTKYRNIFSNYTIFFYISTLMYIGHYLTLPLSSHDNRMWQAGTKPLSTALFYTPLHCTALYCTALHCTLLYCTALHCTALHCTALHCTELHCIALYCTKLHCTSLRYSGTVSYILKIEKSNR